MEYVGVRMARSFSHLNLFLFISIVYLQVINSMSGNQNKGVNKMILVECCDYDGSVALETFDGLMEAETAVEEVVKSIPDHPDNVSYKCVELSNGIPVAEHTYCMDLINRDWKWGSRPLINDAYTKKWRKIRKLVS